MTASALHEALNSQDPEVRELAASALIVTNDPSAKSLIHSALLRETVPRNRLNMAHFLISLSDKSGVPFLVSFCQPNAEDDGSGFQLAAADNLFMFKIDDPAATSKCFDSVVDLVRTTKHSELRANGLFILGKYKNLSPQARDEVRKLQIAFLGDPDPLVRSGAVQSIEMTSDASLLPMLNAMKLTETDKLVHQLVETATAQLQTQ
jgi:HEAT repeat protein